MRRFALSALAGLSLTLAAGCTDTQLDTALLVLDVLAPLPEEHSANAQLACLALEGNPEAQERCEAKYDRMTQELEAVE